MKRLTVITGGTKGIGLATARVIASKTSSETDFLAILARSFTDESRLVCDLYDNIKFFKCDVREEDSVKAAISSVCSESKVNSPSLLVNAAGISLDKLVTRTSNEDIENVIRTNLMGTIYCSRECLKLMLKHKPVNSSIVNIGSVVGTTGNSGQSIYSASKSGLVGFTKSLAREVGGRKIRANVVIPGYTVTDMTNQLDIKSISAQIPLGRFASAEEVAESVVFLGSQKAEYITGQCLVVDGGLT